MSVRRRSVSRSVATPLRAQEIRKVNERIVLQLLHDFGPLSQSDIASRTGLQPSTVFRIFLDLAERAVVREVEELEPDEGRKGRRPSYYSLNPTCAYAAGVELSPGSLALLLVNFVGEPVAERIIEFSHELDAEGVIDCIVGAIDALLHSSGVNRADLLGVGIGAPGVVDIESGAVTSYARFPGMVGLPLRRIVSRELDTPVFVHNNASVIAASEYRYGRAKGYQSLAAFLIRSGVGGAYINNADIFVSQQTTAFEVGHLMLDTGPAALGRSANAETLEDYLCESAILRRVQAADAKIQTLPAVIEAIQERRPAVCEALDVIAGVLYGVVFNLSLLLNPEVFLIITRYASLSQFLAESVARRLPSSGESQRFRVGAVLPLEYDPMIACRGAAEIVFDAHLRPQTAPLTLRPSPVQKGDARL